MPKVQILLMTLALLILTMAAAPSYAQTLTMTLIGGNSVNFPLTAGSASNPGSTSITARTQWTCGFICWPTTTVHVYAYFTNAASALTQGPGLNIPSSAFQISNNGAPFQPLINNTPFGGAGAGLQLSTFNTRVWGTVTHDDAMDFNINLSTLPNLAPGTYTGTLTIRAQSP